MQKLKWIAAVVLGLLVLGMAQSASVRAQQPSVLAVIANGGATLYTAPNGEILGALDAGLVVTASAQSEDGEWTQIETRELASGWVESARLIGVGLDTLPKVTATVTATTTVAVITTTVIPADNSSGPSTPAQPQSAVVRSGGATLRDAPNGGIVQELKAGTVLAALSASSDNAWIEVRTSDGVSGWVAASLVLAQPIATGTPQTAAPSVMAAASQTAAPTSTPTPDLPLGMVVELGSQRLNVRSGPSAETPVIGKAESGGVFPVLARSDAGDWLQLRLTDDANGWGWVAARFISMDGDVDSLPVSDAVNDGEIKATTPTPSETAIVGMSGLMVMESADGQIVLLDGESGEVRLLGIGSQPALSHDGRTIVAVTTFGEQRDLIRIDVDSGERERIGTGDANNISPAWSPDGESILFLSDRSPDDQDRDRSPSWSLWIMDVDGDNVRPFPVDGVDLSFGADASPKLEWK